MKFRAWYITAVRRGSTLLLSDNKRFQVRCFYSLEWGSEWGGYLPHLQAQSCEEMGEKI